MLPRIISKTTMQTSTHATMDPGMDTCTYTHTYLPIYRSMILCTCLCTYVRTYIHTCYIHTCTHTLTAVSFVHAKSSLLTRPKSQLMFRLFILQLIGACLQDRAQYKQAANVFYKTVLYGAEAGALFPKQHTPNSCGTTEGYGSEPDSSS